jgi:DNA polymerase I
MAVDLLALTCSPAGRAALLGAGHRRVGPLEDVVAEAARIERERAPRWVWWEAATDAAPLSAARVPVARCWDVAEAHRLIVGGWEAGPHHAWATAHGLPTDELPTASRGDLFDFTTPDDPTPDYPAPDYPAPDYPAPDDPTPDLTTSDLSTAGAAGGPTRVVRPDGYLDPDAGVATWLPDDDALVAWSEAALDCAERQAALLAGIGPRSVATAHSESAAAYLCLELARDGLPVDRARAEQLISESAGPRPRSETEARELRALRDQAVLAHTPGRENTDLRNPAQVRELLAQVGVDVPNTRKWVLEPFRGTHAVVGALLEWRKAERIATTYGYAWLDAHVGPDDRLRGGWTACDGAAGRMTAQNGLHNLPAALRPAVAAHPGHVFVRADLGQIEPRVLAAVSGDDALAAATRADDLYAPVAATLRVERPVAKVAVLAAMYGQRSGAAGEALKGLERAYPVAMASLDRAYAAGVRGEALRTFGGRRIPLDTVLAGGSAGGSPEHAAARDAARGRFARNAVIQGSAAELFKAWAATVRATTRDLGAQIVLCLHDEILVHVPEAQAREVERRVVTALDDSARRWTGSTRVRFVAETSVVRRWSEVKEEPLPAGPGAGRPKSEGAHPQDP